MKPQGSNSSKTSELPEHFCQTKRFIKVNKKKHNDISVMTITAIYQGFNSKSFIINVMAICLKILVNYYMVDMIVTIFVCKYNSRG